MEKPNIVETYAYKDGSVVHIADNGFRDKSPEQLRRAWELIQDAAANCLSARKAAPPEASAQRPGHGAV